MVKQYDLNDDENLNQKVQDDTSFAYRTREQVIAPEYSEPADLSTDLPPYTLEELNARIDEAEEQIARGEVISAEEADLEIKKMFALWE